MIVSDVIDYYTTPIGSTDGYQPSIFGAQSKLDEDDGIEPSCLVSETSVITIIRISNKLAG